MKHINVIGIFLILSAFNDLVSGSNCSEIKEKCAGKSSSCRECIAEHHCCNWCFSKKAISFPRCYTLEELKTECSEKEIEKNSHSKSSTKLNETFTDVSDIDHLDRIVQLQPQYVEVILRKDSPVNVSFSFKPAKNYPLDLYYLGDLSHSMITHLVTMQTLGADLAGSLTNLTKNYRLAYGSFVDKPALPFFFTDPINMQNPCRFQDETCEPGYLFRHRLNFTTNVERFSEQVKKSKTTANADDVDGALDAIYQLLVCNQHIKWRAYSRKMILLCTDSLLHTAGDGLLSGSVKKNDGECMLDGKGDYINPLSYDYPDLGQILSMFKQQKMNMVVATKKEKLDYYKRLKKDILKDHMFVGELEKDSQNILQLVTTGFKNFAKQVQLFVDSTDAGELEVKFFGKCLGDDFNETDSCYDIDEKFPTDFIIQLTLKERTLKRGNTIFVKEKNINETLKINLTYVGQSCTCEGYVADNNTCLNGDFECGKCECNEGWTGSDCSQECDGDYNPCRYDDNGEISTACYGKGTCVCGKCKCDVPFVGNYCEYECPMSKDKKVCSGNSHGTCIKGICKCEDNYMGEDCSCEKSTEKCVLTQTGNLCNSKGKCKCNKCVCDDGFEGKYCEKTADENQFCRQYDPLVQDFAENKTDKFMKDETEILVREDDYTCESPCQVVSYTTTNRCIASYCYERHENSIRLHVTMKCALAASVLSSGIAISLFIGILLAGLAFIALKKYRNYRADQAEYQRFEVEREMDVMGRNENPIYKSPVSIYRNPLKDDDDSIHEHYL